MVKFISTAAFGLALLLSGCFAPSNGSAKAAQEALFESELIADSPTTDVQRTVDCEVGVVIYHAYRGGLAIVKAEDVDPTFMKNKCGL